MYTIEEQERMILDNVVMIANQLKVLQETNNDAGIKTFESVLEYLKEKYEEMKS